MADDLEARRQRLEEQLLKKRKEDDSETADTSSNKRGFAEAMKLSSEFIAAIVVGALFGYLLDTYAGTTPWGIVVFLMFGFAAGVLNVLRSIGAVERPDVVLSKDKD